LDSRQSSRNDVTNWNNDIDAFKDFCQINLQLCKTTFDRYAGDVRKFLNFVSEEGPSNVCDTVRKYLKHSPNNGNSLRALKAYFKFVGHEEIVKDFKFPRRSPKIRRVTQKDLQIFYSALRDWREKALFLFYTTSGLRKMEVLLLRMDDVDLNKRMVIPNNHKKSQTKHSLLSFYNEEAEIALKNFLPTRSRRATTLSVWVTKNFARCGEKQGKRLESTYPAKTCDFGFPQKWAV